MTSCDCPCEAAQHAPVAEFGSSFCLTPNCDCLGTREQVAAMHEERRMRGPDARLERLVDLIREVLGNPMHRTLEEKARNVAAALVGNWEMVER
jgi:hypothetical protein